MYSIALSWLSVVAMVIVANAQHNVYSTGLFHKKAKQSTQEKQVHHILADPAVVNSYSKSYQDTVGELNLGRHYFEGDIILTKQQSDFISKSRINNGLEVRAIVSGTQKLWNDRVVPYEIDSNLSDESKGYVKSAIEEWQDKTCLTIRPKEDSDEDYVEFVYDGGCSSYVGRIGGKQSISVGSLDGSVTCKHGNIVHELAHTLGYFHEHSRPDRNDYITVNWDNIMDGYDKNFRKESNDSVDSRGVAYDYDSVTHYGSFFFTKEDGEKTIKTTQSDVSIGQRVGLSDLDIVQARLLYNCDGDFDDARSNTQLRHRVINATKEHEKKIPKAGHLKKAVKHFVKKATRNKQHALPKQHDKMNKKAFVKDTIVKIEHKEMNNTEGFETMTPANTLNSIVSTITQQAMGPSNTQQAIGSSNTQQAMGPSNTQQAIGSSNTQQAIGSSNTQQASGPVNALTTDDENVGEENIGKNYFEGDMMLSEDQRMYLDSLKDDGNPHAATKRALIRNTTFLWPKRTVYYTFDHSVDKIGRENAENAVTHWKDKTCLDFKKRTDEEDYINFVFEGGCASRVGRGGGMQKLTIGSVSLRCKKGNIIHELGHALGFFHEHSRPDRDEYVKVLDKNIESGFEKNFLKFSKEFIDSRNVPYDYGSIMHYGRSFFSKSRLLLPTCTMITKKKTADDQEVEIGQRHALSDMDILQANLLYGCDGRKRLTDEQRVDLEGDFADPMSANQGPCGDTYDISSCSVIKSLGYCEEFPRTLRRACGQTCQLCSLKQENIAHQGSKKSIATRLRLNNTKSKSS